MLEAAGEQYRVTFDEARSVLPGVQLPGRFQRVGKFVLDVAHNVEGMRWTSRRRLTGSLECGDCGQ